MAICLDYTASIRDNYFVLPKNRTDNAAPIGIKMGGGGKKRKNSRQKRSLKSKKRISWLESTKKPGKNKIRDTNPALRGKCFVRKVKVQLKAAFNSQKHPLLFQKAPCFSWISLWISHSCPFHLLRAFCRRSGIRTHGAALFVPE